MKDTIAKSCIVSAGHPQSAEAGLEMLKKGGNAVDAAIAAAFATTVVEPANCGIGGYGGSMVIYLASTGKTVSLDFNSKAPLSASADMYSLEGKAARETINSQEYN